MPAQLDEIVITAPLAHAGVTGRIRVPPSKSVTQRALVAAALAPGSRVVGPLDAEDPRLLAAALSAAGYRLTWGEGEVRSEGFAPRGGGELLMGNNGTGARFMLAQLAVTPGRWRLDGDARLRERPVAPLVKALVQLGASIAPVRGEGGEGPAALPLEVVGRELGGGEVTLDAGVSSQFLSALLLLAPRLPQGLAVRLAGPPASRPYLDLTAEVLARIGVAVEWQGPLAVRVPPCRPVAAEFAVEGDWSAAAFPMAAVAVAGGSVEVEGVRLDSRQGDATVARLLAGIGCSVEATGEGVRVSGPASQPLVADLRDTPDLFPPLAVVTACLGGRLGGLAALAVKESDRLAVMTELLGRIGFAVWCRGDVFGAAGGIPGRGGGDEPLWPARDHRVAMALAVAGSVVPGVRIADPHCVAKSWPGFWSAWARLSANAG